MRISMSMTAKKKRYRDDEFIAIQILQGRLTSSRRRRRFRHILPLLSALSACLLLLFAIFLFLSAPVTTHLPLPRHLNKFKSFTNGGESHMNAEKGNVFRVPMSGGGGGGSIGRDLWTSNQSSLFYGCSNASNEYLKRGVNAQPNRYLLIATSGGLNQQRTGVVDAVVAAYILNATLVVPKLDQKSFWKDNSNFSEIFDVDWYITSLSKDVKIIKQLPETVRKIKTTRAPRKCSDKCYETRILPIYGKKRVQAVQLTKFDYRLSNGLDKDLQKLRCRVNYHALRFTNPILEMGMKLVERMRMKSQHFVALHLRFEADMLAFSRCYYGGGEKEMEELGKIRKRWKTLHKKNPEGQRRRGKCPLSPEEVGLMLRALGFGNEVHIYVASGQVYRSEETLAPLKALFPNFHTKESIASKEELAPFSSHSSRMAALDFIVCDESDVFVTNNNGNMAKMLAGKRRYFGHKPTIRPNAKKLQRLFLNRANMSWEEFASSIRTAQAGFMGEPKEVKQGRGDFHEHPLPCICENSVLPSPSPSNNNIRVADNWDSDEGQAFSEDEDQDQDQDQDEEEQDLSEAEEYATEEENENANENPDRGRKEYGFLFKSQQHPEPQDFVPD